MASAGLAEPALGGATAALLVGVACIAWGLDNNLTSLIDGYSTAEITCIKGACAGSLTVPIGWWVGGQASAPELLGALLIGAVGYGVSLVLYVAGAQQLGATRSQLCFSTAPLFGLAVAWGVFGETIGPRHLHANTLLRRRPQLDNHWCRDPSKGTECRFFSDRDVSQGPRREL